MTLDQVKEPTWGSTPKLIQILVRVNKLAQIINGCVVVRFQCVLKIIPFQNAKHD